MSEHQPPEPEPEPLAATSLEFVDSQPTALHERQRLLTSMVDAIEFLVEREDGVRKNIFAFRREKIVSCPERDAYPNGCKVHLSFYTYSGLAHTPRPSTDKDTTPPKKFYDQEYKNRRFAGLDIVTPVLQNDPEMVDYSIMRYQIVADDNHGIALKQFVYSEEHDADIASDVNEETVSEVWQLLQSFVDEGGKRLDAESQIVALNPSDDDLTVQ